MNELQEIEVTLQDCHEKVELLEALEKLERSAAFKKLFLKGYIDEKPKQATALFASPDERQARAAQNLMIGVAQLEMFMHTVRVQGEHAKHAIEELEAEKLAIVAEE